MATSPGPGYYPNGKPIVVGGSLPAPQPTTRQGAQQHTLTPRPGYREPHAIDGVPHHSVGNGNGVPMGPPMMTPEQVRAMQTFLNNHGFEVAQDGIMGPLTKSAAAAFRANHKSGATWSAQHGVGTHPGATPHGNSADPAGNTPSRPAAKADTTSTAFNQILESLLAGGGKVGTMYDPASFGQAAEAPDIAQALALSREISQNGAQENQNQQDISSWYGLDPTADSYKLSVLGRLGTAGSRDAQAASDAESNVSDIAKSLAGSIGGSANGASGGVLSAGADAAGTMGALGQEAKQFADDMNPLLAAEARGQMSREKAANAQSLLGLRDKLAQAQGQAQADQAQGVMSATDKNNSIGQQRFADEGNLLSTLSQMMAVDPTYNVLRDAKLKAQIDKLQNPGAYAAPAKPPKVDLAQAGNSIAGLLGVGTDHKLPAGTSPTKLAYTIGSQLQALGFKKGTPEYQRYGQQLISMFNDASGNPINAPRSWFGPGS